MPLGSSRKAEFYLRVHSGNPESSLGSLSRRDPSSWKMGHHTFSAHRKCLLQLFGATAEGSAPPWPQIHQRQGEREHTGMGMPWDFWVWDFWALFICSRNAQSGSVCTKKLRRGIIPTELNPSRPLSVKICIP